MIPTQRTPLALLPTPLQDAPALAKALGIDRPLLVKRDDLTGPGMGGNKVRKLEYLMADALARGADCLVTVGAAQSNSARLTAVAGAMVGLETHLVLSGLDDVWEGNLVLDAAADARIHRTTATDWEGLAAASARLVAKLQARGRRPYAMPLGGSTPVGALGYVQAQGELLDQLDAEGLQADWIVHASSSGGTQAGLVAGRILRGRGPRVFGADVIKGGPPLRSTVAALAAGSLALAGSDAEVPEEELHGADFTGPDYGAITASAIEAIRTGIRSVGIVPDPVYAAKALGAIPALVAQGALPGDGPIVFLLTGGQPALFARRYADALCEGPVAPEEVA